MPRPERLYTDCLEMELGIIIQMGFAGYFLIVADFISWSKQQRHTCGPAVAWCGSLVAYALTITDLDPIRWGLLFESSLTRTCLDAGFRYRFLSGPPR